MPPLPARFSMKAYLALLYMISTATIVSILLFFFMQQPKTVHATPNEMGYTEDQYPFIVGTKLDSCTLCHTEVGSYLFNPYGQAYNDQIGSPAEDFKAIEKIDSDGDGYTNIQEIKAGTNPGDPKDHPQTTRSPNIVLFLPFVEQSTP